MDEYHERIYKATKEHEQEFKELCQLRRENKFEFKSNRTKIANYNDLLFAVYDLLDKNHYVGKVYSDKVLDFFRIINEHILFFEGYPDAMSSIFQHALKQFKNKRNGEYFTSEYGFVRFNKDSKIVELRDLTHFTIDLSKIFKINSDWNLFPENLKKHKLQIRKSIYKSLIDSMIDRIDYFYSDSYRLLVKWKNRNIELFSSRYFFYSGIRPATVPADYNTLSLVTAAQHGSILNTITALDNVLESIYKNRKEKLLTMSPINIWPMLENITQKYPISYLEELIQEILFDNPEDYL